MAQILRRLGFGVRGLVLIDSPYPENHEPLPEEIVRFVLGRSAIKNRVKGTGESLHLRTEFQANATLLGKYPARQDRCDIKTVVLRSRDSFDSSGLCGVQYEWLESQTARTEAIKGWEAMLGQRVDVLDIPGHHFQAFDEQNVGAKFRFYFGGQLLIKVLTQVVETSKQIEVACRIIEEGWEQRASHD